MDDGSGFAGGGSCVMFVTGAGEQKYKTGPIPYGAYHTVELTNIDYINKEFRLSCRRCGNRLQCPVDNDADSITCMSIGLGYWGTYTEFDDIEMGFY